MLKKQRLAAMDGKFHDKPIDRFKKSVLRPPMKANEDMVQGYCDGFDLDNPEPSANRSRSYRHGFANGRDDKRGEARASYQTLIAQAEEAMILDASA